MINPPWTIHSAQQSLKRKRAEAACEVCHSKKIRCDIHIRKSQGYNACTTCAINSNECRIRIPRRERNRRKKNEIINAGEAGQTPSVAVLQETTASPQSFEPSTVTRSVRSDFQDTGPTSDNNTSLNTESENAPSLQQQAHMVLQPEPGTVEGNISSVEPSRTEFGNMSGYVVDTGFLNVYAPEHVHHANRQATVVENSPNALEPIKPELLQSFAETYFEYCYTWCPILDKSDLFESLERSPLLTDALVVAGSHVRPPIYSPSDPAEVYERARQRFYNDEETDVIVSLRAVSLFYWWSSRPPARVHRHSSWWWTSVIIRHAQQLGVHRELSPRSALSEQELGLRRRLWWTAFARERLTAVCQGTPCIINPEECSIKEVSLGDFPPDADQAKAEIFIFWVRLCGVIGKVARYLAKLSSSTAMPKPDHPGKGLVEWINSLPSHMRLPIDGERTVNFNRDVHQLHLPYLAVVIVLHLKRSEDSLPVASSTAILAATCIARIFKDILIRGATRFLMPISCWYCAMAFIALSYASKRTDLKSTAEEELDILHATMRELQKMWGTANVFEQGFRRLRSTLQSRGAENALPNTNDQSTQPLDNREEGDMNWLDCFPFATSETSPIAKSLFAEQNGMLDLFTDFPNDFITILYPELLESFDIIDTNLEI